MPKYLIEASYSAEGAKGLIKGGGTARRAEVQKMVEGLGGHLDAFYFVFGENDVHVILDLPENLTAAAISLVVLSTGAARIRTSVLLTPEETESGKLLATFQGHTGGVYSAIFSPDGRRVLTASEDKTAQLRPVLPAGVPPPDWCGDFLVWLGGKRVATDCQIETLFGDELLKLEARLLPHLNEDTDYALLRRWRLLTAEERPVDPYGTITQAQAADLIIRPDMNKYDWLVLERRHPQSRRSKWPVLATANIDRPFPD